MSSSQVHVAVTQAEPVWLDLQGAVEKTCKLIREAAANKAQLIAFPECFIPGYPAWIWYAAPAHAQTIAYLRPPPSTTHHIEAAHADTAQGTAP